MKKQISIERIYNLDLNDGQKSVSPNLLTKEIFYDRNGNTIREISYNPPGVIDQIIESKYDEQNRLSEEACFDGENELLEKIFLEWDAEGKKIKESKHYMDGSVDTTTFLYNSEGKLIEKLCKTDEDEIESKEVFNFEGKHLIEYTRFDENQEVEEKKSFSYLEDKLQEEITWESDSEIEITKKVRYNEDGLVEKELYYNPKGQLIKKAEYLNYNGLNLTEFLEEDPYRKNTTRLDYDENNNIILQEQFNRNGEISLRVERHYNEHQQIREIHTFANGQGTKFHVKEIHEYDYFE